MDRTAKANRLRKVFQLERYKVQESKEVTGEHYEPIETTTNCVEQ